MIDDLAPIENAREELAVSAVAAFVAAVRARAAQMDAVAVRRRVAAFTADPVRDPAQDRPGRFGFLLPLSDGSTVRLLMPGVAVESVRDDLASTAPVVIVDAERWWWNDAVSAVASTGTVLTLEQVRPAD